jgi:hypothetical protein
MEVPRIERHQPHVRRYPALFSAHRAHNGHGRDPGSHKKMSCSHY